MTCRDTKGSAEHGESGHERHRLLRQKVAAFHERIWNARDYGTIAELLHEDVSFRGSRTCGCSGICTGSSGS